MKINGKFAVAATLSTLAIALFIGAAPSRAGVIVSDGFANAQFRRTVDPSDRSAAGKVNFRIHNGRQTCTVQIIGLGEKDFGIFVGGSSTPDTNSLISSVGPLDRTVIRKGNWMRFFSRNDGAPLEFDVENLSDLSGGIMIIGKADENLLIQGVTNVVGNVTNILVGIPLPLPDVTNVIGGVLWAPIPPLLANPSILNFNAVNTLHQPEPPAPSPSAAGMVRIKFNATQGRSVLDVRATGLIRGQTYSVFIGDVPGPFPNVLVLAGEMEANKTGSSQRFLRDTKLGDPLPEQVRDSVDLYDRLIQIRDAFGNVHLEGFTPGNID